MSQPQSAPWRIWWRATLSHPKDVSSHLGDSFTLLTDREASPADLAPIHVIVDADPEDHVLNVEGLRHVIIPFAGVRPGLRNRMLQRPHLTLHNSHYNAPFVVQHVLSLLLSSANKIVRFDRALRRGDWQGGDGPTQSRDRWDAPHSMYLRGKVALLVGYGAIGQGLVAPLHALGMKVRAIRRTPSARDEVPTSPLSALKAELASADVVVISLPGTDETRGLFDQDMFDAMKDQSILINVGRGNILDEKAAWNTLNSGKLHAMGLDVWWLYPKNRDEEAKPIQLPSAYPFHEHPDVIMSPHRSNAVEEWRAASARDVLLTIEALRSGSDLRRNLVNLDAGY